MQTGSKEPPILLLDKLAHLRTKDTNTPDDVLTPICAVGPKTPSKHVKPKENLKNRAKNLAFSQVLKQALIKVCPDSKLVYQYRNSLSCSTIMKKNGDTVTSTYCNSRYCNVCNRIRTGKLINQYEDVLSDLRDPYFVTLTCKNVDSKQLRETMKKFLSFFSKAIGTIQKRMKRSGADNIRGFRKLECTHNQDTNEFHPHVHIIIEGKENAEEIVQKWLKECPTADEKGQDIRKADIKAAKELFKYVTKLLPKRKKVLTVAGNMREISWAEYFEEHSNIISFIKALDQINLASQNIRTFQHFGFKMDEKPELSEIPPELSQIPPEEISLEEKIDDLKSQQYEESKNSEDGQYEYDPKTYNWVNHDTGEMLIKPFDMPGNLSFLLRKINEIPAPEDEKSKEIHIDMRPSVQFSRKIMDIPNASN